MVPLNKRTYLHIIMPSQILKEEAIIRVHINPKLYQNNIIDSKDKILIVTLTKILPTIM